MSLKCKIFGHKHVAGTIENVDDITRCLRCGTQLIYEDKFVLVRTLRGRAKGKRKTAEILEDNFFEESARRAKETAEVYDEAAEILEERFREIKEKEEKG